MADYHHDDDPVGRGFGSTLGVILAIVLVLVLLVGGWLLLTREPVDDEGTDINIEQPDTNIEVPEENGDTTTTP